MAKILFGNSIIKEGESCIMRKTHLKCQLSVPFETDMNVNCTL